MRNIYSKESGSHLTGLTGVFDGLTKSKAAVEQIESEVNEGHHIITQEEALQLAWAKNDIREKEKNSRKSLHGKYGETCWLSSTNPLWKTNNAERRLV